MTTYVIQLYDVVKVKFLYDKTRHEHSRTDVASRRARKFHGHYNVISRVAERHRVMQGITDTLTLHH